MIEVHPGLFVGDEASERAIAGHGGWFTVHACKEPWHRRALGYEGRGAPRDHPEYLIVHRPDCIILNLVDAPTPELIPAECIAAAIQAIADHLPRSKVLVHCNAGRSRSPIIALLYLALHTETFDACDYDEAAAQFLGTYPPFAPAAGVEGFARRVWAGEQELAAPKPVIPEPILAAPRDAPAAPRARISFTF